MKIGEIHLSKRMVQTVFLLKKGKIPKNVQETFFMVFIEAKNIFSKCPRKDTFLNMFLRR